MLIRIMKHALKLMSTKIITATIIIPYPMIARIMIAANIIIIAATFLLRIGPRSIATPLPLSMEVCWKFPLNARSSLMSRFLE